MHSQQHPPPLIYNPAAGVGGATIPHLPPGWVEYRAPTGQPYWYNTMTRQSSWIFPSAFVANQPLPRSSPMTSQQPVVEKKKKHQIKKKIPNTHWLFVITPEGYEFYYDRENKTSVWEMPEELEEGMALLKKLEEEEKEKQRKEEEEGRKRQLEAEGALEQLEEAKRIKLETGEEGQGQGREAEGEQRQDQAQVQAQEKEAEEPQEATEMTEEDIMWQLQQMEQDEAEEEAVEVEEKEQKTQPASSTTKDSPLSEEECIRRFNELLKERNISPFAVYSAEYPKLMSDPRFSLIPSHKQKALFNKYCNALGEKIKQEKAHKKKPQEEFKELLEQKVTKKMYWEDFRRKYKNDPRFQLSHSSMTTKEKEALFKDHVKHHLNSKKKRSPKDEYFELLRDTKEIRHGVRWRDAKKILEKDDRFWLVESKEEREDLFRDYLEEL
ncbi:hypothetical protein BDF20DRAFT_866502 [Mycotypha africana]|uniref:uncharacterized protein n=1 Tax=Mycotypha africana TaxID=64632 RepID=UPI0023018598|nr:uncharacterized protein BDF20DRAFT_866502 [Mycotypha africana]KAI8982364.1 hypothetical protein BDF20DRAFT_866502 [Mycotypha africana]